MKKRPVDLNELGMALEHKDSGAEDSGRAATGSQGAGMENDERTFDDASEVSPGKEERGDEEIDIQAQLELPISDEEEDELAAFIETLSGGQFDFPKFHGLLTALVVGPVRLSPFETVQVLSQKSKAQSPISTDFSQSEKILGLIARLQNEIILDLDGEIFEPESFEREHTSGEIYPDTLSWCEGFALGIDHHREVWEKWYKDWRQKKVISPIEAAGNREFRSSGTYFETPEEMWALYNIIERAVPLVRCFWRLESGLDAMVEGSTEVRGEER
jgi:yecA family protein